MILMHRNLTLLLWGYQSFSTFSDFILDRLFLAQYYILSALFHFWQLYSVLVPLSLVFLLIFNSSGNDCDAWNKIRI